MSDIEEGGCACGAVRYRLRPGFRMKPYACHCTDCQKRTGSAFSEHMLVMRSDIDVVGDLDEGQVTQPSGAVVTLVGCPLCRSRLFGENSTRPGVATLRVGSLDNARAFPPAAHFWIKSKQPWIALPEGVPALDEQPRSNEDWMALLGPQ